MRVAIGVALAVALGLNAPVAHTTSTRARVNDANEGRLVARDGKRTIDLPLRHTDVRMRVDGFLADVTVTQRFHNPYAETIEAVYLFPLPTGAAVNHMEMRIGTRTLHGTIHKRAEATRVYKRAKREGHTAALLTQERPNLFTQRVANIESGAEVSITLRYVQTLAYERGGYELVFPMVAPPRYVPPTASNASIKEAVQPKRLAPGVRSRHRIDVRVDIAAGVPLDRVSSPSHAVVVATNAAGRGASVSLAAGDRVANRDFILRYRMAGSAPQFAVHTHRAGANGSFFLMAQPPSSVTAHNIAPRELIFVVDTSSSMRGAPLAKAKQVIKRVLGGLRDHDTFQVIRFADSISALGSRPIANKPSNIRHTLTWVDSLTAGGSTEMVAGLDAAFAVPHDPARLRLVVFLTDGYIGNEDDVLARVSRKLGASRLFSFGVGTAVNRYLLQEMAALGRGTAQFVRPDEPTKRVVDALYRRIDKPVLTDISIDWNGLAVRDVVPSRVPDLFAGQPVVLAGHYDGHGKRTVTISGMMAGRRVSFPVEVSLPRAADRPSVATVWARRRIAELSRTLVRRHKPATVNAITSLALRHKLLSRYTAFVAVDRARRTKPGAKRVHVPVEVPQAARNIPLNGNFGGSGSGGGAGWGTIGSGSYGISAAGAARGRAVSAPSPVIQARQPGILDRRFDFSQLRMLKGHRISAPVVSGRLSRVVGPIDKTILTKVIHANAAKMKRCYEQALTRRPGLGGRVEARYSIGTSGAVIAAKVQGIDTAMDRCLETALMTFKFSFPAWLTGTVHVVYPYVFKVKP